MTKDIILKAIQKVTDLSYDQIHLDYPENSGHGDYSSNIALQYSKFSILNSQFSNPKDCATWLIQKLQADKQLKKIVEKIEIAGSGFINFFLNTDYLSNALNKITKAKNYGTSDIDRGKKVVVEYSSPNIAKPFTVGHLRSTIIGDAIANLLEASGWSVYRDNHLGDWGTQFGKLIYMIKQLKTSQIESSGLRASRPDHSLSNLLSDLKIKDLVDLYVEFHKEAEKDPTLEDKAREEFKKLEEGDPQNRKIWQYCVDISMQEFNKIYSELGIAFTENEGKGYGESFFEDKMQIVLEELSTKGLLKEGKDGAKLVFFPKEKYPPLMIVKKDGTTLYATRDLATDKFRLQKYGSPVVIINEVGAEQTLYFQQLFEIENMLGWVKDGQRVHIKHGHFRFADKKMSTRSGNVIWLTDVLSEATKKAKELGSKSDKSAQVVGIGALKWNELKRDPIKDIVFDWKEMLSMEGNSGPYLQYTYARCRSVLAKPKSGNNDCQDTLYSEERDLMVSLDRFPEVIINVSKTYSVNLLCEYLFNVAQNYNTFYNKHKILGSQKEEFRVKLTQGTSIVLQNGLKLLGIEAPERM